MNRTSTFDVQNDSTGAIVFIIVVLIWYSLGMVCLMGMQINGRVEDCARRRAKLLIDNLRDQTHTKQILEELVDKQNRAKLWNLYLDRTDEKLLQAETLRIRNIEKQLAILNQNHLFVTESFMTQSTIIPERENRIRVRRRSSFDQQILERWKILVEQCKTPEQLPFKIQNLIIRRHFRRHYKSMLR